jgi:hypothetical protein
MSKNNKSAKLAIHASSLNFSVMAFAKVGNGSSWTATNSSRKFQIRSCGHGLLHQMGGSKSIGKYHDTNNPKNFLAKHRELTVDNGKQFDCYSFKEYCKTLGTHVKFLSVYHLQSNGVVKRANGLIFSGIKKCLFDEKKGKWTDELPKVIWSHNTTVSRAMSFTPFRLLFGTEAMTTEEIKNESMEVQKAKEI